jgi:hypothetical protein
MALAVTAARREAETRDFHRSAEELAAAITELHRLVRHPFRGLLVPEQVQASAFSFSFSFSFSFCLILLISNPYSCCGEPLGW